MTAQGTRKAGRRATRKADRKAGRKADREAGRKADRPAKPEPTPTADAPASSQASPKERQKEPRSPGQLRGLLRATHPRQALAFAVVVAVLVALTGRPAREVLVSAVAVLVAQLAMGLLNDLFDIDRDRMGGAKNKPVAEGIVPPGNASFAIVVLLLLVIPLSLQNGTQAGVYLLATLVVGFVHNRWLHPTLLSWVGWAATFALLTFFVTYGGWGRDADGSAPLTSFVVLCAALGLCVHFLTALPDLVVDNQAGLKHLPLRIALRTGAPRLMVIAGVTTLVVLVAIVVTTVQAGAIAR
jgi:4-hydroxybenzoate polyprenyltransferase